MSEPATGVGRSTGRRLPRWTLVLLITSLALNLIIVGLVAGSIWRFRTHQHWTRGVTPNLLGYTASLPSDRRNAIWTQTAEQRQHIRPYRREIRAAREELMHVIATDPFDKQRFEQAQARLGEAYNRARTAVQTLDAEIVARLTPEERQAFPGWREKRRPPGQNLLDEPDRQVKDINQQQTK